MPALRSTPARSDHLEWISHGRPVTRAAIISIAAEIGVVFPDDYVEYASTYHGGHPNPCVFDFPGHHEAAFNRLLSYDPSSKGYVLDVYHGTRDRMAGNIIPFADDPFGNLICFMFETGGRNLRSVVFWDHELTREGRQADISRICSTFSELLSALYSPGDAG